MSGEFWKHHARMRGDLSENDTEDESIYQAWRVGGLRGETVTKLLLVPAHAANPEIWRIPYLQTILQRYDRQGGQLCLMFPSSDLMVFFEGRGLDQLDQLLDSRRVRSIHMFDPDFHHPVSDDLPIITKISIQQS